MEPLISYIVRGLVEKPDSVEIRTSQSEAGELYELRVAPEDVGKVIGRDGRTINALRTLVAAAANKRGTRARLDVLDDRRSAGPAAAAAPNGQPSPGDTANS